MIVFSVFFKSKVSWGRWKANDWQPSPYSPCMFTAKRRGHAPHTAVSTARGEWVPWPGLHSSDSAFFSRPSGVEIFNATDQTPSPPPPPHPQPSTSHWAAKEAGPRSEDLLPPFSSPSLHILLLLLLLLSPTWKYKCTPSLLLSVCVCVLVWHQPQWRGRREEGGGVFRAPALCQVNWSD